MKARKPVGGHKEMVAKWMKDPAFRAEYDALEAEFKLLNDFMKARKRLGLSQADVAERMGTKPPAIARLEAALSNQKHSPTVATLKKYAEAVGCELRIRAIPINKNRQALSLLPPTVCRTLRYHSRVR